MRRRNPERRHLPWSPAGLALLALLLAVPVSHGSFGHAHATCHGSGACEVEATDAWLSAALGIGACPLCLASSNARTLLQAGGPAAAATVPPPNPVFLPPTPASPTPLARAIAAPRAPPASR